VAVHAAEAEAEAEEGRMTPVLLPREVADLLRVPESTVRAMARDGRLR
jgi:hypothetical protein